MNLASCLRRYAGIHILRVLVRELGSAAAPAPLEDGIECRLLTEREVLDFAVDPALQLDAAWIRNAFVNGGACLGALQSGRLIGYNWLAYADTQYARGVWLRLQGPFRYSYKTFVRPEYRGRRIAQALHALADSSELRRGRLLAVNLVDACNHASLAALRRTGSRPLGWIGFAKCLGVVLAFHSPGVRRAGLRFYGPIRARIAGRMRPCPPPLGI